MLRQILILLHLSSAIVWVGGMFFAYFCLRPAAAHLLEPPARLPLWVATFDRFFRYTAYAIAVILASGIAMFIQTGTKSAPAGWHVMAALGLAMTLVFAYVYGVQYPKLRQHCESAAWPAAAATLNRIRRLVAINLALATCTVAAAALSR